MRAAVTWFYRIAVNLCLNAIRDRDRRPTVALEPQTGAVEPDQHEAADLAQRRVRLRLSVDHLPPKQRVTMILRTYHDLPFAEGGCFDLPGPGPGAAQGPAVRGLR